MVDQWLRNASNHFGELESSYIRGRRRGKEEGRAEGLEEGLEKGRIDVAYQMLREGFSYEMIEKLTGLSSVQIDQLSQNHQV
ncbi:MULTISPECIES: hypothetical protein [Streptococcus]|uniref:Transposase n=1 Tax=Streptococcus iners TaxID=3028084 RepID=A0AA97AEU6_9STRE|nr:MULTISPECIES: hypothetical protein [Streptococcus]MCK4026031.1 hypothetical protein [Streptococcus suis]WNY51756.1 hypothetical protein PW252_03690 [Streptococcus sp. 29887]